MNFGQAIEALKAGKKVSRNGWNGKGMYLWCKQGTMIDSSWCKDPVLKAIADANGGITEGLPTICLKTADNKILTGWNASQPDIFAEDWYIVGEAENSPTKLIKGQSIQTWLDWVNNELTPPVEVEGQTKYVVEAFKEALLYLS